MSGNRRHDLERICQGALDRDPAARSAFLAEACAGDEVLREVAQLLVKHSRSVSIVTRYGGDEFAIILVNTTKAGGLTYAERIRNVIEQNRFAHSPVTASLGIASLPEDATTVDDLVVAADRALYDAKRLGRNRAAAP